MKQELQDKLVEKYPKIFSEVGKSPQESCMAFGLCVGDGWYWIIDQLCKQLQYDVDNNQQPQIVAAQVKEKFGGLRFYTNSSTETQDVIISFAENVSLSICEKCGITEGVVQTDKEWIKTLCKTCVKKGENYEEV